MTDEPRAVAATFSDFRLVKTRGVAQFVFEVPIKEADAALGVLGGVPQFDSETWVGITPIRKPSGSVADRPAAPPPAGAAVLAAAPPRQSWYDMKPSQRAALLCKDQRFWEWARRECGLDPRTCHEVDVRSWMLPRYKITSRVELDFNDGHRELFEHDEMAFRVWAGLEPDPRR